MGPDLIQWFACDWEMSWVCWSRKSTTHICSEEKHSHGIKKKGVSSKQITAKNYLGYMSKYEVAQMMKKQLFLSTFHPPSNLIWYSFQRLCHPKHLKLNSYFLTIYVYTNRKGLDFFKLLSTFQLSATEGLLPVELKAPKWLPPRPSKCISNLIQKKIGLLI